jgi:hypothetical protein
MTSARSITEQPDHQRHAPYMQLCELYNGVGRHTPCQSSRLHPPDPRLIGSPKSPRDEDKHVVYMQIG